MTGVFFIGSSIRAMHGAQPRASPDIFTDIPILLANAVLPQSNVYGVLADEKPVPFARQPKNSAHAGRRDIAFVNGWRDRAVRRSKLDGYCPRYPAQCGLTELSIFRAERSVEGGRLVTMEHILLEDSGHRRHRLFTEDTTAVGWSAGPAQPGYHGAGP